MTIIKVRSLSKYCIKTLLASSFILLASCASSSAPDPEDSDEAKEIKAKSKSSLDLPELELFSNAKRQYSAGLYSVARESFIAIKDNYPTGPFAEYAEIKIADSLFENNDYAAAASSYEEFTKNRPTSTAVPYALLRAARSYELTSSGIGRDPTPLEKSAELYTALIEKYPNSVYTKSAKFYKKGVLELLASYEQSVIAFYESKEKDSAQLKREEEFSKRFGISSSNFNTSEYDKKAGLELKEISQTELEQAKKRLNQLPPISSNRSFASNAATLQASNYILPKGKFQINSVSCDPTKKLLILGLDPKPNSNLSALKAVKKGDSFEVQIADLTTVDEETKAYSCFQEGDLTVSSSGLITLKYEAESANVLYVDNPSRVILTIK